MKNDKSKQLQKSAKKEASIGRSSAAEYLTVAAATGKGGVEAVYADKIIWMTQKMMATICDVDVSTVNNLQRQHVAGGFSYPKGSDNCR